jgi:DNA-directed RNA polymerase subunit L
MNLKVSAVADNATQVQIDKEDYSVADIVHKELLGLKHVKFAGVPPPHPLIKTLTIQVHTDGTKPTKSLVEAVEVAQERVADLLKLVREVFPQERPSGPGPSAPKEIDGDELAHDHVSEI